ncbi:MAG: hypothetical protein GVY36_05580 [Verrucomicrobia bacterium]|jgi:hypothetical protein|nr:hypothetical protein [Verrucomicrobiota bacterium]
MSENPERLGLQLVAENLTALIGLADPADGSGRLFVYEQNGLIRILRNGLIEASPFLDIEARTLSDNDQDGGTAELKKSTGLSDFSQSVPLTQLAPSQFESVLPITESKAFFQGQLVPAAPEPLCQRSRVIYENYRRRV